MRAIARHVLTRMRDTGRRNIYLSAAAIPAHLILGLSKGAVMFLTPSLFILANAVFTLGLGAVKLAVVLTDRRRHSHDDGAGLRRTYRFTGLLVLVLSLAYISCCIPFFHGQRANTSFDQAVAIGIATVSFAELGLAIHGYLSSRRNRDLLMEAVKLSNLAGAFLLIVLTQAALLSLSEHDDPMLPVYNGISGIVFGTASATIGVTMLVRSLRSAPHTLSASSPVKAIAMSAPEANGNGSTPAGVMTVPPSFSSARVASITENHSFDM